MDVRQGGYGVDDCFAAELWADENPEAEEDDPWDDPDFIKFYEVSHHHHHHRHPASHI